MRGSLRERMRMPWTSLAWAEPLDDFDATTDEQKPDPVPVQVYAPSDVERVASVLHKLTG